MGKSRKAEQEKRTLQKKKQRRRNIIGVAGVVFGIVLIAVLVTVTRPAPAETLHILPGGDGDLHIASASLQNDFGYVDYGGTEELVWWRQDGGVIRTALDTCEECYGGGSVRYTLREDTLTCSLCGTTQPVSNLGADGWGGCKPVSITPEMREDSGDEIIIPAAVLSYAEDMFAHWDAGDYSVSFADYGTDSAHVH